MRSNLHLVLAGLLAAGCALPAHSAVSVAFVEPAKYADAGRPAERDDALRRIERHLQQLGARYLGAGDSLSVEVLDLDRAGRENELVRRPELRIMRGGADWPSMTLRYRLESGGRVVAGAEERLSDMSYLRRTRASYADGGPLQYELYMLDEWFERRIVKRETAPR